MIARDNTYLLPDGRKIGYAVYGDTRNFPVLYFHGIPGSRLQQHPDVTVLRKYPICIYALDRPGIGLSSYVKKWSILNWIEDVIQFTARFEQFAVLGVSGGGPYALACAYLLPERLRHVSVISGLAPLKEKENFSALSPRLKSAFRAARYADFALKPLLSKAYHLFQTRTAWAFENLFTVLAESDRRLMKEPAIVEMFKDDVAQAFEQGSRGVIGELKAQMRPWGFDLKEIRIPVHIWHGAADTMIPAAMAQYFIRNLKQPISHMIEAGGHFMIMQHRDEVFRQVCADIGMRIYDKSSRDL